MSEKEVEKELMAMGEMGFSVPASFLENGFTDEESLSGMPPADQSYLKSFPYFIRSTNGSFVIMDNAKDEVVWTGTEIKGAIVYYGHEVARLKRGYAKGLQTDEKHWEESDKELVAVSYDKRSTGNFVQEGYDEYLSKAYKDLHKKMKRLYIFIVAPSLKLENKFGVIAGSFGISTAKGLSSIRKELDQLTISKKGEDGKIENVKANLPLPFVKIDIRFVPDTSDDGNNYQRISFEFSKNKETGGLEFAFKSPQHYRDSGMGLPLLEKIIASHKAAIEMAENGLIMMAGAPSEKSVLTAKSTAVPTGNDSDDDIPF